MDLAGVLHMTIDRHLALGIHVTWDSASHSSSDILQSGWQINRIDGNGVRLNVDRSTVC